MRIFLLFCFSAALCLAQDARPSHHPTRERTYHVHHYKLNLTFDEKNKTCKGEVAITLSPLRSELDTLRLDAAEMNIQKVTLRGKPLEYRTEAETLVIVLDHRYAYGESLSVSVAYDVSSPKRGLYFVKPDSGYPNKHWQVWSQGEADDNHFWFPCYDYPNDFSTSEMYATVNEKFTAIGNGKLMDVKDNPKQHAKTFHWLESKPHVSYLISIIAGEYIDVTQKSGALTIHNYVYKNQKGLAMNSFSKTPRMMDFYSKKIGYPYPWEKFAQTVVQDFIYGGEENVSAVTLTDVTMHDARAHLDNSSDGLVAHELAHQWWGDLVTCRDWSQAWLNEGFATFFENQFLEFDKGKDESQKEMHDTQNSLSITDVGDHRRATVSNYYFRPIELFDGHIYGKGACVLAMLKDYLGEELFWKSINHYVHKHAFDNVETNDFKIAIEEVTGQNLEWFFNQWIYKPGFPEFEVSWKWDSLSSKATVNVSQTQKIDSLTGLFTVPVTIELWVNGKPQDYRVIAGKENDEFTFPTVTRPQLVMFDKGSVVLKRVSFQKSIDEWISQLRYATDAVDRSIALDHLRPDVDTARVAECIANAALHDSFWDVRKGAAFALGSASKPIAMESLVAAYSDPDARVRAAVVSALSGFRTEPKALVTAQTAFRRDSSYLVAAAALTALTEIDSTHAMQYCTEGLQRDSYREVIRNAAIGRLAVVGGDEAFDLIKRFTRYGIDREVRIGALRTLGKTWVDSEVVADMMIGFLYDPAYQVRRTVIDMLGTIRSKKAVEPLRQIVKDESDGQLIKLAQDAIERITKN